MSITSDFLAKADALTGKLSLFEKKLKDENARYEQDRVREMQRHDAVLAATTEKKKNAQISASGRLSSEKQNIEKRLQDLNNRNSLPRHPRSQFKNRVGVSFIDFAELDDLSSKIQSTEHKLDKLLHRHGYAPNQEMVDRYYSLVDAGIAQAQRQFAEAEQVCNNELSRSEQGFSEAINAENHQHAGIANAIEQTHRERMNRWNQDLSALDRDPEIPMMGRTVMGCFGSLAAGKDAWQHYLPPLSVPKELLLGTIAIPSNIPPSHPELVKYLLKTNVYNEKAKCFVVPLTVSALKPFRLIAETDADNTMHQAEIARSWILRQLALLPKKSSHILLIDPVNRGSSLGKLSLLAGEGGCGALKTALSQNDISLSLAEVTKQIDHICELLAKSGCRTIYDYNQRAPKGKELPYTTVIIQDYPAGLEGKSIGFLDVICNKSTQCGISLFISHKHSDDLDHQADEWYRKNLSSFWHLETQSGRHDVLTIGTRSFGYRLFPLEPPEHFYGELNRAYLEKAIIKNEFNLLYPADKPMFQGSAVDGLEVPFAVEPDGTPVVFRLGYDILSYAFISGSVGSGKTTLLHALIAGMIWSYAPSELEIWLVDFKQTEFAFYEGHCPAHVKYVAANESSEIAYSVLDELELEMARRRRIFSKAGVKDFVSYRKSGGSMPRLLVVVDEFHRMAQATNEDESYKTLLENVVSEYRAFGLVMILCDQMISQGLGGLSGKAKNMISVKIAMRNKPDEVRETLQIPQSFMDDAMRDSVTDLSTAVKGGLMYRQETLAAAGENGNKLRFVSCRSLYIPSKEAHAAIIDAVNAKAGRFEREKSFFIAVSARPFSEEQAKRYLQDHAGDDRESYLIGSPMGLQKFQSLRLEPGIVGENILLVGTDAEKKCSILFSVIFSALQNGRKVTLLTPKNDPFYSKKRDFFRSLPCRIIEGTGEICRYIAEHAALAEECDREDSVAEKPAPELAVFLAPEELYRRMEASKLKRKDVLGSAETEVNATTPIEVTVSAVGESGGLSDMMSELDALLAGLDVKDPENAEPVVQEKPTSPKPQQAQAYNALDDWAYLLHRGPSAIGLHTFLLTDKSAFLRELRSLRILDNTNHRIALRMSPDDASAFMSRTKVMRTLSEDADTNCAVYSNMGGREIAFRPFLRKEDED